MAWQITLTPLPGGRIGIEAVEEGGAADSFSFAAQGDEAAAEAAARKEIALRLEARELAKSARVVTLTDEEAKVAPTTPEPPVDWQRRKTGFDKTVAQLTQAKADVQRLSGELDDMRARRDSLQASVDTERAALRAAGVI